MIQNELLGWLYLRRNTLLLLMYKSFIQWGFIIFLPDDTAVVGNKIWSTYWKQCDYTNDWEFHGWLTWNLDIYWHFLSIRYLDWPPICAPLQRTSSVINLFYIWFQLPCSEELKISSAPDDYYIKSLKSQWFTNSLQILCLYLHIICYK